MMMSMSEDESELDELEEQLSELNTRLGARRKEIFEKESGGLLKEAEMVRERLNLLEKQMEDESKSRTQLHQTVQSIQDQNRKHLEEEMEFEQQLWNIEQEHMVEEMVDVRQRFQATKDRRQMFDAIIDKEGHYLEGLDSLQSTKKEMTVRDVSGMMDEESMLKRALNHSLLGEDEPVEEYTLVDELAAQMRSRYKLEQRERQTLLHELNVERRGLLDQDLQYGGRTPTVTDAANLVPLEEYTAHVEEGIDAAEDRIWGLRKNLEAREKEREKERRRMVPYNGEFGMNTYMPWQLPYARALQRLVLKLADDVVDRVESEPELVRRLEKQWRDCGSVVSGRARKAWVYSSSRMLSRRVVEEVCEEMFEGVAQEFRRVSLRADRASVTLLLSVLLKVVPSTLPLVWRTRWLRNSLSELRRRRADRDAVLNTLLEDTHKHIRLPLIRQTLPITSVVYNGEPPPIDPMNPEEDRPDWTEVPSDEEESDVDQEWHGEKDPAYREFRVLDIQSAEERHVELPDRLAMERRYWKGIDFQLHRFFVASRFGGPTECTISRQGDVLFVGTSTGRVLLLSLLEQPFQLMRVSDVFASARDRTPVKSLQVSNLGTEVIAVQTNALRVWDFSVRAMDAHQVTALPPKNRKNPEPLLPPANVEIVIRSDILDRTDVPLEGATAENAPAVLKALAKVDRPSLDPVCGVFFTGMAMSGQQPSIIVGTRRGVIVKWNTLASKNLVFGRCMAPGEPDDPEGGKAALARLQKPARGKKVMNYVFDVNALLSDEISRYQSDPEALELFATPPQTARERKRRETVVMDGIDICVQGEAPETAEQRTGSHALMFEEEEPGERDPSLTVDRRSDMALFSPSDPGADDEEKRSAPSTIGVERRLDSDDDEDPTKSAVFVRVADPLEELPEPAAAVEARRPSLTVSATTQQMSQLNVPDIFDSLRGPTDRPVPTADVQREFFQCHQHPICFLGFSSRSSTTIFSMDEGGLVCEWKYRPTAFSGFGWFTPSRKAQLLLHQHTYIVKERCEPETVFPPVGMRIPRRPETNEVFLAAARQAALRIRQLRLPRAPWMVNRGPNGSKTMTFVPRYNEDGKKFEITKKGAFFHRITLSGSGVLLRHEKVKYVEAKVKGLVVQARQTVTGRELVVMTVFPSTPRDPAMIRFFSFDLMLMEPLPFRIDLPPKGKHPPYFTLGPVLDAVGTDHVYLLLDNAVHVYSLSSGKKVTGSLYPMVGEAQLRRLSSVAVSPMHRHLVVCGPQVPELMIFEVKDCNDVPARRRASIVQIPRPRLHATPAESRVRRLQWDISKGNAESAIRAILAMILDNACAMSEEGVMLLGSGFRGGGEHYSVLDEEDGSEEGEEEKDADLSAVGEGPIPLDLGDDDDVEVVLEAKEGKEEEEEEEEEEEKEN